MTLSQVRLLSTAISRNQRNDGLNTMNWTRVAYHADGKEFAKITKDLVRK